LDVTVYSFHSQAGSFDDRFEVRISKVVTGIEPNNQQASKVYASGRNIVVETGIAGKTVSVYTASAVKIAEIPTQNGIVTIPASQGIYVVRIDNEVYKVVVF
jgi:hypothetical protein